jgi:hypothetical protein
MNEETTTTQEAPPAEPVVTPAPAPAAQTEPPSAVTQPGGGEAPHSPPPGAPSDPKAEELAALKAKLAEYEAKASGGQSAKERYEALAADVAKVRAEQAETRSKLEAARRDLLINHLPSLGVATDMAEVVAGAIGDVDLNSPAGREKIQKWMEKHPSLTARATPAEKVAVLAEDDWDKLDKSPFVDTKDLREKLASIHSGGGRR